MYPEALTCSPRLVRVDFMRMKKERSCTREEAGASAGLGSGEDSRGSSGVLKRQHGPPPPQSQPDGGYW